jgi:hypothetical protein
MRGTTAKRRQVRSEASRDVLQEPVHVGTEAFETGIFEGGDLRDLEGNMIVGHSVP